MSVTVAILAAGQGNRFGADKTVTILGGRPLWMWSFETFVSHPEVDEVLLVGSPSNCENLKSVSPNVILGGETRQASSHNAVEAAKDSDILLVHDAARPFVSQQLISSIIAAAKETGAAAPAVPVTDTIKQIADGHVTTLDRTKLVAMQTPQAARTSLLREAHRLAQQEYTDEMALLEAMGIEPTIVLGEHTNFKITTPEDLYRAKSLLGAGEYRNGFGYDVHPFSHDPERTLFLGGIPFPGHPALDGHSDADVLLHAATDALLGAAGLGDIGVHFPNNDPRWKGEPSLTFLRHAASLLLEAGWKLVNLDMTVVAEAPKIMAKAMEIREMIAQNLGVEFARISVKATTNEKLGFIGRGEGIAALATATIVRQ